MPREIYSKRSIAEQHHEAMPLLPEGPTQASLGGLQFTSFAIVPFGLRADQEAVFEQPALEALSVHALSPQRSYRMHLELLTNILLDAEDHKQIISIHHHLSRQQRTGGKTTRTACHEPASYPPAKQANSVGR